jgi:hypothetical protein
MRGLVDLRITCFVVGSGANVTSVETGFCGKVTCGMWPRAARRTTGSKNHSTVLAAAFLPAAKRKLTNKFAAELCADRAQDSVGVGEPSGILDHGKIKALVEHHLAQIPTLGLGKAPHRVFVGLDWQVNRISKSSQ